VASDGLTSPGQGALGRPFTTSKRCPVAQLTKVELEVYQHRGSSLNVIGADNAGANLEMTWADPAAERAPSLRSLA
jgi:hypothetical protein